jgi:hypothetical protein
MATNPRIKPIEHATNRTWDAWLAFMNRIDAKSLDHRTIALKVHEELEGKMDNAGWWAQSVAVAYEQHIGRRLPGQRSDGTFEMSVSKATQLGMKELMEAWTTFAAHDKTVLGLITGAVRVGGTDKRLTWRVKAPDGSALMITSEPKGNGTASIIATQTGLQTHELNTQAKETWTNTLEGFVRSI